VSDRVGGRGSDRGPLPPGRHRDELVAAVAEDLVDLEEGSPVVLALSGGPDSTALAYLVTEARPDLAVTLCHVRHGLRDDAEDLAVAERHAGYLGVPLEVVEVEVTRAGRGTEAAARDARHTALRDVRDRVGARGIVVGHTADDQAETVLLRAARGTGVTGLAAMRRARDGVWRPLLRLRREDLRRFVALEGHRVATDPTNDDRRLRRVIVRHEVLPRLTPVGPDPVGALARLAALAAEDDDALEALARALLDRCAVRCGAVVSVRQDDLTSVPPAVGRRVWRQLLAEVAPGPPPSAAVIADLLDLRTGRRREVGDVEVSAGGGWRAVAPRSFVRRGPAEVVAPGATPWEPAGVVLHVRTPDTAADAPPPGQIAFALSGAWTPPDPPRRSLAPPPGGHADRCVLPLPADLGPLTLRHRAPGDRVRTVAGTRRVADVFVDAGVPRAVRDRWPLLAAGDRVVWVPGVEVDGEVLTAGRATPALQAVVGPAGRARPGPVSGRSLPASDRR
jgi:tRNA(Ile)-lysidine synthase